MSYRKVRLIFKYKPMIGYKPRPCIIWEVRFKSIKPRSIQYFSPSIPQSHHKCYMAFDTKK